MSVEKDKKSDSPIEAEYSSVIGSTISSTKKSIDSRLNILSQAYELLKEIEVTDKGFRFRQDTLEAIFRKYPNLSSSDVAQGYFFAKLKTFLLGSEIIFGDMPEIRENLGKNQFNCDSVGFIDLLGNGLFNTCLFKLFKTEPDLQKIIDLNKLFSSLDKDIFIGGSTYVVPFKVPDDLDSVSMPKMPINNKSMVLKNGVLLNAMGYLNSAYYTDRVKASFVLGSHNIAEPMHAGKLTVISNDLENRYNHNWLISYFGEKTRLLLYMHGKKTDQGSIDDFLSTSREELQNRYDDFQRIYEEKIKSLIYGIFYRFLVKNFPDKFN